LEGDWHEFESKALRKENERKDKENRRAAQKEKEKEKKRASEGDTERDAKRQQTAPPGTVPAKAETLVPT
jgi:CTD kinase subunit alpha